VEKHGGTLTVNSSLGQGSEFVISLPVWAVRSRALGQVALPRNYESGY
jgi:signal transduction histidine kinase